MEQDENRDVGNGDSYGIGGVMNAKLAEKLKTLDDEIKRYRQENAAIEQIRKEKEKVKALLPKWPTEALADN